MNIKENYFNLNNKTIFVSGAYSFLGKSMCDGLGCYGANLILNGTNIEKLNKLKKYLSSKNIKCSIARFDITNYQEVKNYFKKVKTLDVIVHNANKTLHTPFSKFDKKNYFESYNTAVLSLANLVNSTKVHLKKSAKKNGTSSIINISSMYGVISPDPDIYSDPSVASSPQYGAAKAAMIHHTKYLAVHLGKYNIRVNSISPGAFPNSKILKDKNFAKKLASKSPLKRTGKPHELISSVLYLASKSSSFTTGTNLLVDGGWTAW
jgi:NAD(P)-dependent dehydrogenase (short-subunit alcohol dehydrogenase family)